MRKNLLSFNPGVSSGETRVKSHLDVGKGRMERIENMRANLSLTIFRIGTDM